LHNKQKLHKLAESIGIDTPISYKSYNESVIPFVCKPVNLSSSKGVKYFFNKEDKKKHSNSEFSDYIFQEYIEGFGCGYSVYAKNGVIISGYGHKRLAEFPISGGTSVYRTGFYDDRMKDVAEKIFDKIKWTGFAMIEFKYTKDNRLVLIEVNPRIWGSINQGLQNGINYFEPILGKSRFHVDNNNKKTFFSPFIYIIILKYIFNGNFRPFITFIRNFKYNRADVNFFNDLKGWLSLLLRKIL